MSLPLICRPFERDAAHIATLAKFLSSVDFFAGLTDGLRSGIAGIATLRVLRKDEVVYAEGDESTHLFVVLAGSVGTRVRDFLNAAGPGFVAATTGVGEMFGQETAALGPLSPTSTSASASAAGATSTSTSMSDTESLLQVRSQTKVALERSELLMVHMGDYAGMLRAALSKESGAKMAFLASLPLFESLTLRELARISAALTQLSFPKNHVIIKQGQPADKMYFIVEGQLPIDASKHTRARTRKQKCTSIGVDASSSLTCSRCCFWLHVRVLRFLKVKSV